MAFDGITMVALVHEISNLLLGGHVSKISQPEKDEIFMRVKNNKQTYQLQISANPSLPLFLINEDRKNAPLTAPNFCMVLRKYLVGARITNISQYGLERVASMDFENTNELGDHVKSSLKIEMMGKHSNIIYVNDDNKIIDSIKHISAAISSVREVLPERDYFIPNTRNKHSLYDFNTDKFLGEFMTLPTTVVKGLNSYFTGFGTNISIELAYRAGIDPDMPISSLTGNQKSALLEQLRALSAMCTGKAFSPCIAYKNNTPVEFGVCALKHYNSSDFTSKEFDSVSICMHSFYLDKQKKERMRQKTANLRKTLQTLIERNTKKLQIQTKQVESSKSPDKYRVYGELINTYGYSMEEGASTLKCTNFYDNKEVSIRIDPTISISENANHYFDRYNKLKRTYEYASEQLEETKAILDHLQNIYTSLDIAENEADCEQIRKELYENGYIKKPAFSGKNKKGRATAEKSKPLHFISSDGYDMYVGKNNYQNDQLTFKMAYGDDWWFHVKKAHGSHVIIKSNHEEPPIKTFEEAAALAAYYSEKKDSTKVEIDYTIRKNVKRPNGSKPGFVVYYTNYSMVVDPDITGIKCVN